MVNPFSTAKKWAQIKLDSLRSAPKETITYSPLLDKEWDLAERYGRELRHYTGSFQNLLQKHNIHTVNTIPFNMRLREIKSVSKNNSEYELIFSHDNKSMKIRCPRALVKDMAAQQAKREATPVSKDDRECAENFLIKKAMAGDSRFYTVYIEPHTGTKIENKSLSPKVTGIRQISNSLYNICLTVTNFRGTPTSQDIEIPCPREAIELYAKGFRQEQDNKNQAELAAQQAKLSEPKTAPKTNSYDILLKDYNLENNPGGKAKREGYRNALMLLDKNDELLKLALSSQSTQALLAMRDKSFKNCLQDPNEKNKAFYEKCSGFITLILNSRTQKIESSEFTEKERTLAFAYLKEHKLELTHYNSNSESFDFIAVKSVNKDNCTVVIQKYHSEKSNEIEIPLKVMKKYAIDQHEATENRVKLGHELAKLTQDQTHIAQPTYRR